MIEIDGSYGEGGGQLLRYSIALAALLRKDIHIFNIRAKRSNPGLRRQHLTAIKIISKFVDGRVEGLEVGSKEIYFYPRQNPRPGKYFFDIGTAGSIPLLLQAVLPVMLAARGEIRLELKGGTIVRWSPPIIYIDRVLVPLLRFFGAKIKVETIRHGFYPRGGGLVIANTKFSYPLQNVNFGFFSHIKEIGGISYVGNLPVHIAERQAKSAERILKKYGYIKYLKKIEIDTSTPAIDKGTCIVLWALTDNSVIGGDSIGERGKPAEKVGEEAAMALVDILEAGVAIDPHALDNLIIYMSLADGLSRVIANDLTSHARTAIDICSRITGAEFRVNKKGKFVEIIARGIGYKS
ncbi:MAG: RNA 3'-terminal phosphate cyclase [Thermoproteales archaeon]|nr:RNA 3'-terminal phosphate cyclase [Thermoproteales archaeon]